MDWLETEISPEDEADILEGIMDLDAGRKIKAEDIWKELKDSTFVSRKESFMSLIAAPRRMKMVFSKECG